MKGFLIRCVIGIAAGIIIIMSFFLALASLGSDDTVYAETYSDYSSGSYSSGTYSNGIYIYAGRTYTLFKQGNYGNVPYAGGSIADSGCGVTSVAICVSGFKSGQDPASIANNCVGKGFGYTTNAPYGGSSCVFKKYLEEYGLTSECIELEAYGKSFSEEDKNKILNHLQSGNPIIFNYGYRNFSK